MPTVVVASDANWVRDHVRAALCGPGFELIEVERGRDVRKVVADRKPDLVIVDLQIANMGGMAVALDLRLEESGGRLPHVPILLLLDREADRFLARRGIGPVVLSACQLAAAAVMLAVTLAVTGAPTPHVTAGP